MLVLTLASLAGCAMWRDDALPGAQAPSNKWRIEFEQTATSDGSIDFLVSPEGGNALTVSVPVVINQTEEEIAKAAHTAFMATLDDGYEVNEPTGADIHVKKASHELPNFGLTLQRMTARDGKVHIDG